jgi:hypothetical protein
MLEIQAVDPDRIRVGSGSTCKKLKGTVVPVCAGSKNILATFFAIYSSTGLLKIKRKISSKVILA